MSLRSQFDALVGKRDRTPDGEKSEPKDGALDFKTMVKVALPKLKLDAGEAVQDETLVEPEEAAIPEDDKTPAASSVQGVFGQTILAFEQLLHRQRQDQGNQPSAPDEALALDGAGPTPVTAEIVPEVADEAGKDDTVRPGNKTEVPVETMAKPTPQQAAPELAEKPEEGKSQSAPAPAQAQLSDTETGEPPISKNSAKVAVDQPPPPAVSAPTAAQSIPVQAETKLTVTPASPPSQPVDRPQITDARILSDRSSGATRMLVIQLEPVELGTVTARLRLTSEGMHIQLTAEGPATAEHLARDHETLSKAMQRAGVADDASSVTISVIDRSSAASNTPAGQQNLSGQEQQAGARSNGQNQSGYQGTPDDRSTSQQPFGDMVPDEREEKLAIPGLEKGSVRGLVV